jgi:hypothetical protein
MGAFVSRKAKRQTGSRRGGSNRATARAEPGSRRTNKTVVSKKQPAGVRRSGMSVRYQQVTVEQVAQKRPQNRRTPSNVRNHQNVERNGRRAHRLGHKRHDQRHRHTRPRLGCTAKQAEVIQRDPTFSIVIFARHSPKILVNSCAMNEPGIDAYNTPTASGAASN